MGVVILGGGLAGLSCGWRLLQRGVPCTVVERDAQAGGKAASTSEQGFSFDRTGHWLHLRDDAVRAWVSELLDGRLIEVERQARVRSHGVFTRYPFQAHTYGLPQAVIDECVTGFRDAHARALTGDQPPPRDLLQAFEQWFGGGITRHFMAPYNQKLWGVPLTEITPAWCSRFVPRPSLQEVVQGSQPPAGGTRELGYNPRFVYPADGGIGCLAERIAQRIRSSGDEALQLGQAVTRVDWKERRITLRDGRELPYVRLISSLPLPALVRLAYPAPPAPVADAVGRLRAASVAYVDFGVRGLVNQGHHWVYFPDPGVPFYRVGSYSNAVPHLAPDGHGSLYVETSRPPGAGPPDWERLLPRIRALLVEHGLIESEAAITLQRPRFIEDAYVLYDHAHAASRATALEWVKEIGVEVIGRYGRWTYSSMEDALIDGLHTGER